MLTVSFANPVTSAILSRISLGALPAEPILSPETW